MGQKTNPIGNRLGFIKGWDSNWYGGNDFGEKLAEDAKIRKYLRVRSILISMFSKHYYQTSFYKESSIPITPCYS